MNTGDLDKSFDEALERATQAPVSGAYELGPLAADHLLLSRSWAYFNERIAAIETHWETIGAAKNEEIAALKKELLVLRAHVQDLEDETNASAALFEEIKGSTISELEEVKKKTGNAHMAWEQERQILEERSTAAQIALENEKRKLDVLEKVVKSREDAFMKNIESQRSELAAAAEKFLLSQKDHYQQMLQKDEELQSRDAKIEVLRTEIEKREQLSKSLSEENAMLRQDKSRAAQEAAGLRSELEKRIEHIAALESRLALFSDEKKSIMDRWNQEKAEWRELWDRSRDLAQRSNPPTEK